MYYDFQIFCSISIPPRRHRILFSLKPDLKPWKTVKKIKTMQKRYWTIQSQLRQRKRNIMWNSTIRGVINSDSFRNHRKVKVLLYALCAEAISVLHMEEETISIDKRTPQSICGYCTTTKKINRFWCKLRDCKLRTKSSENWTAFFWFSGWTQSPFEHCRWRC